MQPETRHFHFPNFATNLGNKINPIIVGTEGFYHGLVLGLIALMDNQYKIKSNRESGDGRYDISMFPKEERYPGIIMELKWKKNLEEDKLAELADEALSQIEDMRYDAEMKEDGIKDILKFGIAFSGKKVCVKKAKS